MKKILMVMMILTTFLFVSCKNSIEETYTVEGGFITDGTCDSAMGKIQNWSELNYSNFTSLRSYLRYSTVSGYSSEIWTISEIEQFLLPRSVSVDEVEFLKRNGYSIFFFHTSYEGKKVWMSISRN